LTISLALLGVLLFLALPSLIREYRAKALKIQTSSAAAFSVNNEWDRQIGWLEITYPETIRADQNGQVTIAYSARAAELGSLGSVWERNVQSNLFPKSAWISSQSYRFNSPHLT
jgi:type II secretory pathway pseudopilin PulG